MKRNGLKQLLQTYAPYEPEEKVFKKEILTFIEQNELCFERALEIGHVTASAWLLSKDRTQALIMYHAKLNKWVQLGGHCDGDSDVLSVALKEAQEESGIACIAPVSPEIFDIDVHLIPETPKEKAHVHYDVRFLLHVTSDEQIQQNHESKELRWITKDMNTLPTSSLSIKRMFQKWLVYE